MNEPKHVAVIGLPESGKTTFLAALWHLVTERDLPTSLKFGSLGKGDSSHLNAIAARWRSAKVQERTRIAGNRTVAMNLLDAANNTVKVTFPDTAGEAYQQIWEDRECDLVVSDACRTGNFLLFIHADNIESPNWLVDEIDLAQKLGLPVPDNKVVEWHPRLSPTQVQLVDILQLLQDDPLAVGPRKLGIMLSAWDKAEGEGLNPTEFLKSKLPLLAQYLDGPTGWDVRVYGLSAQGGDYDRNEEGAAKLARAQELRDLDKASTRIRLVQEGAETHDLTAPLVWLTE